MTSSNLPPDARAPRLLAHTRRLCVSICLLLAGCGAHSSLRLPPRIAGQIPSDYKLEEGRALVLARFSVHTNGVQGFGAISNPMLVQFRDASAHGAWGTTDESPQGLSLSNADARIWTSDADRPTLWQYAEPGLMAASFRPGTYDGLVIAYPDAQHEFMPDSIPAPSQGMVFEPVELEAGAIVYLGTVHIEQRYGLWDQALDRVHVDFTVTDDAERTIADFRARYPQFRDTPVETHLLKVANPSN